MAFVFIRDGLSGDSEEYIQGANFLRRNAPVRTLVLLNMVKHPCGSYVSKEIFHPQFNSQHLEHHYQQEMVTELLVANNC